MHKAIRYTAYGVPDLVMACICSLIGGSMLLFGLIDAFRGAWVLLQLAWLLICKLTGWPNHLTLTYQGSFGINGVILAATGALFLWGGLMISRRVLYRGKVWHDGANLHCQESYALPLQLVWKSGIASQSVHKTVSLQDLGEVLLQHHRAERKSKSDSEVVDYYSVRFQPRGQASQSLFKYASRDRELVESIVDQINSWRRQVTPA
jgi:hypothetical protein